MIERLKTIALVILVTLSLFQTYLLVYQTPHFEPIETEDYVQTEQADIQLQVEQLIKPQLLTVHLGDGSQRIAYQETVFYEDLWKRWTSFTFENLQRTGYRLEQWDKARQEREGIEIQFPQPISITLWKQLLNMNVDRTDEELLFDTLYISTRSNSADIEVWLINRQKQQIDTLTETNFEQAELSRIVNEAISQPIYRIIDDRQFVPETGFDLPVIKANFELNQNEQLWQRIFIDPGITRTLTERDGTKIYTDGNRGLQFKNNSRYIVYSDPVAQSSTNATVDEGLSSAVQFVNEHGGWNGSYMLSEMSRKSEQEEFVYEFRQMLNGYPLIADEYNWFGYSKVKMKSGTVSGYQRTMLDIQTSASTERMVTLPGAEEIVSRLESELQNTSLLSIRLAYQVAVNQQSLDCVPGWYVTFTDGSTRWLRDQ
jgi:regulatory protein YycH of two-component signal transduction system YycFG